MRFGKILAVLAVSTFMMTGLAEAQSSLGGGTPDAKGGAVGRDNPSSMNGRGFRRMRMHSMRMKHHGRMHHRHHM